MAAAKSVLGNISATLSSKGAEVLLISNVAPGLQLPAATAHSLAPGFKLLPQLPTEQDIQQAIDEFKAAHSAENQAYIGLSASDKAAVKR